MKKVHAILWTPDLRIMPVRSSQPRPFKPKSSSANMTEMTISQLLSVNLMRCLKTQSRLKLVVILFAVWTSFVSVSAGSRDARETVSQPTMLGRRQASWFHSRLGRRMGLGCKL